MVGTSKAEFAFGKVLICLRMSNLDYIVKETPYSAYLTIRKKFSKTVNEEMTNVEYVENNDTLKKLKEVQKENAFLRQKVDGMEEDQFKMRTVNNENYTIIKSLENDKCSLEEEIEEAFAEVKEANRQKECLNHANKALSQNIQSVTEENNDLKTQIVSSLTKNCEKCQIGPTTVVDTVIHAPIHHEDENEPSTSKCTKCDFESDTESDLEVHSNSNHVLVCNLCQYKTISSSEMENHELNEHSFSCTECLNTFKTPDKLDDHTCKLEVTNPSLGSFYTRSWVNGNGCNAVFCNKKSQEVAILHCERCVANIKSCSWAPYLLSTNKEGVTQLELQDYIENYTSECKTNMREIMWIQLIDFVN